MGVHKQRAARPGDDGSSRREYEEIYVYQSYNLRFYMKNEASSGIVLVRGDLSCLIGGDMSHYD